MKKIILFLILLTATVQAQKLSELPKAKASELKSVDYFPLNIKASLRDTTKTATLQLLYGALKTINDTTANRIMILPTKDTTLTGAIRRLPGDTLIGYKKPTGYDTLATYKYVRDSAKMNTAGNYTWTGINKFNNYSTYFNNLIYTFPSTGRIPGSCLYDPLGTGVYEFRKMQPYLLIKSPLRRNVDSLAFDFQNTNLKLTNNRLDLIQNIRTTDAPTFAGFTALNGNIPQSGNYGYYNNYVSGFGGSGFRLDYGLSLANKSTLEIDNLTVRGTLSVYELLARQIRATNGSIFVSASAKVESVNGTSITFIDETNSSLCPFAAGDLLKVQRFKPDGTTVLRNVQATVSSVSGRTVVVVYNTGTFAAGDEVVRVGNNGTTPGRDVSIYMTSDDTNAPFIDMITGVNSWTAWASASKTKLRLGNLTGITDADFGGALSGYGIYAAGNAYFKGFIRGSEIRGGYFETSDRTNTALDCVLIDGINNTLEFRKAGRTSLTDCILKITSNAYNNMPGIMFNNGVISFSAGTSSSYMNGGQIYVSSASANSNAILGSATLASGDVTGAITGLANNTGTGYSIGVYGQGSATSSNYSVGVAGQGQYGNNNYGGSFRAIFNVSGTLKNYGVQGLASDAPENFGVAGITTSPGMSAVTNYGVYGSATGATTNWAAYFGSGNVYITNELQVGANKLNVNSSGQLTKVNNIAATSKYTLIGDGTSFTPRLLAMSDLPAQTASKVAVTDASGYISTSTVASAELFTPAYAEITEYDANGYINTNGSTFVQFMDIAAGDTKNLTVNTTGDYISIPSGYAGEYEITGNITFKGSAAGAYYWAILKNGTLVSKSRVIKRMAVANEDDTTPISCLINLTTNDQIALGCLSANGNRATITYMNIKVIKKSN